MTQDKQIVIFETSDQQITLPVSVKDDTVWLSSNQMAMLFGETKRP